MATRMIVFDMDGTLVQARAAAWEVFQETAEKFDLPIRSAEQFFALFRTNFFAELDRLCLAERVDAEPVRQHFMTALRERYTPRLVPGMADVVKALAPHYALSVMSSNAMEAIRRTLETAGLASCFAHVFSADVDPSKAGHLRKILSDPAYAGVRACSAAYVEDAAPPSGEEVVLVTDTVGDVNEGVEAGVRVIGVAWGMHSEESLRAAGAEFVACWPQELISRLLPDGACRPGGCTCTLDTCASTGSCSAPGAAPAWREAARIRLDRARTVHRPRPEHRPEPRPQSRPQPQSRPRAVPRNELELGLALARIAAPRPEITATARRNAE